MLRWSKNVNCNEKLFNYLNIDKPELESLVLRGRKSIGCVVKNAGPVVEDVTLYEGLISRSQRYSSTFTLNLRALAPVLRAPALSPATPSRMFGLY